MPSLKSFADTDQVLAAVARNSRDAVISSADLVIKAGGSGIVKNDTKFFLLFNGVLSTVAADTDMPALAGTVTADAFNVYCFFQNSAGTRRTAMGTEGATLADIVFPGINDDEALIGFVVINPTGTGDFVGGTTDLDDATVVPNAAYVNAVGNANPYAAA